MLNDDEFAHLESPREPARELPDVWAGKRIALRFTAGVGDCLIALGGTAKALKAEYPTCHVGAAAMDHVLPLLRQMEGVDEVLPTTRLNDPAVRTKWDVLLEFSFTLNHAHALREGSYYGLVSERVGLAVSPGKFTFPYAPQLQDGHKVAVVHAGASNPNRRWTDRKWRAVVQGLVDRGYLVKMLGTKDEWGIHAPPYVLKLSEQSDDLLWQAEECAGAHLFAGTDSGFAHVCGLLGVPGAVVFTNTCPDDVIGLYPSLKAVDAYERLNMSPTRALQPGCPVATHARKAITSPDVLRALGVTGVVPKNPVKLEAQAVTQRWKVLCLNGAGTPPVRMLQKIADVTLGGIPATRWGEFDLIVQIHARGTQVRRDRTPPLLNLNERVPPEVVRRAVREILNAKEGAEDGSDSE